MSTSPFLPFVQRKKTQMVSITSAVVVHHIGATASSGHYTTCAKRVLEEESDEERWVFFDDSIGQRQTVDYVTGDEANQKNCYGWHLALYSRHEYKK
jgi:uncharacterized UBP type Zn finger protein